MTIITVNATVLRIVCKIPQFYCAQYYSTFFQKNL